MVFSEKILEDEFVLSIYRDIMEFSEDENLIHTEKVLQDDIYFLLLANIPKSVIETKMLFYPPRINH